MAPVLVVTALVFIPPKQLAGAVVGVGAPVVVQGAVPRAVAIGHQYPLAAIVHVTLVKELAVVPFVPAP
jgi:hypothetical protein